MKKGGAAPVAAEYSMDRARIQELQKQLDDAEIRIDDMQRKLDDSEILTNMMKGMFQAALAMVDKVRIKDGDLFIEAMIGAYEPFVDVTLRQEMYRRFDLVPF